MFFNGWTDADLQWAKRWGTPWTDLVQLQSFKNEKRKENGKNKKCPRATW